MHPRSNSAITAAAERQILLWIAARLPAFVTPNRMTFAGVCGGIMCFTGYVSSSLNWHWLFLAALGYIVHWFGDSLDGTLARLRRIERPVFGAYLDQICDVLTTALMMLGIGLSPYVRLDVAALAMIAYLALALLVHMRAGVTGIHDIALNGLGGSEGRAIMIALTFGMMLFPSIAIPTPWGLIGLFDGLVVMIATWGIVTFAMENLRVLRLLSIQDPPPQNP